MTGINGNASLTSPKPASVAEVSSLQPSIKLRLSTNTTSNTNIFTTQVEESKALSYMVTSPGGRGILSSRPFDKLSDSTPLTTPTKDLHLTQTSSKNIYSATTDGGFPTTLLSSQTKVQATLDTTQKVVEAALPWTRQTSSYVSIMHSQSKTDLTSSSVSVEQKTYQILLHLTSRKSDTISPSQYTSKDPYTFSSQRVKYNSTLLSTTTVKITSSQFFSDTKGSGYFNSAESLQTKETQHNLLETKTLSFQATGVAVSHHGQTPFTGVTVYRIVPYNESSTKISALFTGTQASRSSYSYNKSSVYLLYQSTKNEAISSMPNTSSDVKLTKTTRVTSGKGVTACLSITTLLSTSVHVSPKGISANLITSPDKITITTCISQNLHATEVTSYFVQSGTVVQPSTSAKKVTTLQPSTALLNVKASTPQPLSNTVGRTSSFSPTAVKKSPPVNSEHYKQVTTTHRYHKTPITTLPGMSSSVETSGKRLDTLNTGSVTEKSLSTINTGSITEKSPYTINTGSVTEESLSTINTGSVTDKNFNTINTSSVTEKSLSTINTGNVTEESLNTANTESQSTQQVGISGSASPNIISTNTLEFTSNTSHQSSTISFPKATSISPSKMPTTTSLVAHSFPQSRTLKPITFTSFLFKSSRKLSKSATQTSSKYVSVTESNTTILPRYLTTAASISTTDKTLTSTKRPSLGSKTTQIEKSKISTLNSTNIGEASVLHTSSAQYLINESRESPEATFSKATVLSLQQSSSPSTDGQIMSNNTSHAGYSSILTSIVTSSRKLPSTPIQSTQTLTRYLQFSTQAMTTRLVTIPTATPLGTPQLTTTEKYSSKQSSKSISTVQQKRASTRQNVPLTKTSVYPSPSSMLVSAFNRSTLIQKPSMSHRPSSSLFLPKDSTTQTVVITSQITAVDKITSSSYLASTSISKVSQKQSVPLSATYSSKHGGSASFIHEPSKRNSPALTSVTTLKLELSEMNSEVSRFSATSLHPIESTKSLESVISLIFPGHSSLTFSPKTTVITLENTRTQASSEPQTALKVTIKSSQIFINTTTVGAATPVLVTSSSASTQTKPPPEIPSQFEGRMILGMPWQPHYEYPPGSQTLKTTIKDKLTNALKDLEGFISVQVLRLWESSVGVDFILYVNKQATVNESLIERTLIKANSTGVLDLPLKSLQVKEKDAPTTQNLPTTSPTTQEKFIERWVIIIIIASIVVLLLLIIICILVVSTLGDQVCFLILWTYRITLSHFLPS